MSKKTSKRGRGGTAWSEASEIDFKAHQVKQNRFAKRVKREGILLVHDAPSAASLKEVPEADFDRVKVRRSNYADRIKTGGLTLQVGRGRPRPGSEPGDTIPKSVRLPPALWKELEKRAHVEGVAVHALVRRAILALLRSAA